MLRRQTEALVKPEHGSRTIMRRRVVGGPSEPGRARPIGDRRRPARVLQFSELADPPGQPRGQLAAWWPAKKCVSFPGREFFVPPAGDKSLLQSQPADVEGHDVEVMVRVD